MRQNALFPHNYFGKNNDVWAFGGCKNDSKTRRIHKNRRVRRNKPKTEMIYVPTLFQITY
jgi:hypothetical protein